MTTKTKTPRQRALARSFRTLKISVPIRTAETLSRVAREADRDFLISIGVALDSLAEDIRAWSEGVLKLGSPADVPEDLNQAARDANRLVNDGLSLGRYVSIDLISVLERRKQLRQLLTSRPNEPEEAQ
jgi:hypothetical protein